MIPSQIQQFSDARKWVAVGLLVAMSAALSFIEFPLFADTQWLKYDPSAIVALFASLLYGPAIGCLVAIVAWVPRIISDPIGGLMNVCAILPMIAALGWMTRTNSSLPRMIVGMLIGAVASVIVALALNFVVTPLFYNSTVSAVADLALSRIVPFNALKAGINALLALAMTYTVSYALRDTGSSSKG